MVPTHYHCTPPNAETGHLKPAQQPAWPQCWHLRHQNQVGQSHNCGNACQLQKNKEYNCWREGKIITYDITCVFGKAKKMSWNTIRKKRINKTNCSGQKNKRKIPQLFFSTLTIIGRKYDGGREEEKERSLTTTTNPEINLTRYV